MLNIVNGIDTLTNFKRDTGRFLEQLRTRKEPKGVGGGLLLLAGAPGRESPPATAEPRRRDGLDPQPGRRPHRQRGFAGLGSRRPARPRSAAPSGGLQGLGLGVCRSLSEEE